MKYYTQLGETFFFLFRCSVAMTRNQCGISNKRMTKDDIKTKEYPEGLDTTEGITNHLITEASLRVQDTEMDNKQSDSSLTSTATKQQAIPVEQNNSSTFVSNGNAKYVSLSLSFWKRTKSDGAVYKKLKPTCYFGDQETEDKKPTRSRSAEVCRKPVQNAAGICESPVFFSSIGEWTIVDLDPKVFEKEDAKRTSYLRRRKTSYKEVEPENVCSIL